MNDPDNFLSRWSRRKREADKPTAENAEGPPAVTPAEGQTPKAGEPDQASAAPAFDPDLLPPIESIGAGTDISDFLRPGVPEALRHAALRRVWSADPTIRDFVGINENYWDAAGPDGVPGFGALDPGFDVKRMVSELFGERPREAATPDQATGPGDPRDSRDSRDPRDPRSRGTQAIQVTRPRLRPPVEFPGPARRLPSLKNPTNSGLPAIRFSRSAMKMLRCKSRTTANRVGKHPWLTAAAATAAPCRSRSPKFDGVP